MSQLDLLVAAIEKREGFGIPKTLPTRLNNPGDLMFAHQRKASPHPIVGEDGKVRVYAEFPTLADGLYALHTQIWLDAQRGETLAQFIAKYAPEADGNNTSSYLAGVMRALGVADPSLRLSEILDLPETPPAS